MYCIDNVCVVSKISLYSFWYGYLFTVIFHICCENIYQLNCFLHDEYNIFNQTSNNQTQKGNVAWRKIFIFSCFKKDKLIYLTTPGNGIFTNIEAAVGQKAKKVK